jgi:regulator of replication initiation timing
MKETRISLLLLLSMSLLLLAFVILFIWGFVYYRKAVNAVPATGVIVVTDSAGIVKKTRDSMQRIFTATIDKINAALDSTRTNTDSVQVNMDARLKEFYTLKTEIDRLYDTRLTPGQLVQAREKLGSLQKRLDDWRNKYAEVTEENKRLSTLLSQMSENINNPDQALTTTRPAPEPGRVLPKRVSNSITPQQLSVTDLQLKAITEDRKQETYQALQTGQFQGSFIIKANGSSVLYDEIYVVLQQPDGRVLTQSAWDSGSFETRDGRKIYSYKLRFDYQQGENKRLNFSIEADQYQKGTYTMQVYHKGVLLARTTKSLS